VEVAHVKVYLWESKTTSEDLSSGSTFWKRTTLDPQLSVYLPAIRKLGHDPHGAVYDVLRKPDIRPSAVPTLDENGIKIVLDASGQRVRTKDGKKWRQTGDAELGYVLQSRPETPAEFHDRCLEVIAEAPDKYYARGVVVRLEQDEREAAFDTWNTAAQMREARRLKIYPRNPDSCLQWSRECEYLNVCSGLASIDDDLLFRTDKDLHAELVEEGGNVSADLDLLTQSSMRKYRLCPRKFYFYYELRRRSLKKADTLSTGTSIHAALDVYRRTGGDLEAAKAALLTGSKPEAPLEELYTRAKELAMLVGYAARWGKPTGLIAVEQTFRIPLVNPETGAASRTYSLGGRVDAIVETDAVGMLLSAAS
jgi:hypothetical protein